MALPRPICTRLPPDLEAALEARLGELGWAPSEGLRAIVREWLIGGRFPALEFRDTALGRRAAIRGGPEVWEVASVSGPGRADRVRRHFSWVPAPALEEALAYAEEFPDEIDRIIELNARLAGAAEP